MVSQIQISHQHDPVLSRNIQNTSITMLLLLHIDDHRPKARISNFAIVQETKATNLFCNVTSDITLRLIWQCILIIYYETLCKKVVTLTLLIFLINYNEKN